MKICIIFNSSYKNPLITELIDNLVCRGHEVWLYDFISSIKINGTTKHKTYFTPFPLANKILKIKYIRRLFIPFINQMVINKEFREFDVVNIHYMHPTYLKYKNILRKKSKKLVLTIWGSDVLRANEHILKKYNGFFKVCDTITMVSSVREKFESIYPDLLNKIMITFFGVKLLDVIAGLKESDLNSFKDKYKLPKDKLFLSIGYNASKTQQHIKLLEIIKHLKTHHSNMHLLFPLTYGGSRDYILLLQKKLEDLNLSYTLFINYLSDKELSVLRTIPDFTLNIQETDAFSASISESIAGESIVFTGDWLPYSLYDTWGVKIYNSNLKYFDKRLDSAIKEISSLKEEIKNNREIICKKLSWDTTIELWENAYIIKN